MRIFGYDIAFKKVDTPADLLRRAQVAHEPEEQRALIGPIKATSHDLSASIFSSGPTASGAAITETNSLAIAAVYAAVRVLSESVSSLPLKVYRRAGRSRDTATSHPLYSVLHDQGNDIMSAMKLREVMMVHLLLWGNSFSEIQTNGRGDIVGLWPIHPGRVTARVKIIGGAPALTYEVRRDSGLPVELKQSQVLLVAGLGTGILGKSPIQLHREGLGISVAAEKYGAKFFKNDARPGMVLTHPGVLGDEEYERVKKSWNDVHQGAGNAHKIAILEEGMKPESVGLPPEDAQFIETRKFQRNEIASIYRVPPHKIGDLDRATFSNIEHQSIEFVVDSLRPWLVRIEQAMNMQLLMPEERGEFYVQHIVDGLLRGDTKSRFESYAVARNWGWMNADDIRELENQNPLPDDQGQIYLQPLNMVPAGSMSDDSNSVRAQTMSGHIERRGAPPRIKTAGSLEPIYLDVFRRIVKREIAEIRKAVKTYLEGGDADGFRTWLTDFAKEHAKWMTPRLLPVFQSMADSMIQASNNEIGGELTADDLGDFVQRYTEAAANRHAGGGRGQLAALLGEEDPHDAVTTRLDEWGETRADKTARRERERSSNAMTKAAWAVAGVASIVWRTQGENCPICKEMDGRSTLIQVPFLDAGADVAGLITSGSVGHPPIHDGCDCYLIPEIGRAASSNMERRSAGELETIFNSIIAEVHHAQA